MRKRREKRNKLAKFFIKWRRHGEDPRRSVWDGSTLSRKVNSRIRKLPIQNSYKGPGVFTPVLRFPRGTRPIWAHGMGSGPKDRAAKAQTRSKWLEKKLRPIKMRHIKTLGWGGLGVVNLFEQLRPDGELLKVVCKVDLKDEKEALLDEIQAHIATAGAMHVSQRIPPGYLARHEGKPIGEKVKIETDLLMMTISDSEEMVKTKGNPDTEPWYSDRVLFLEFMPRGDLRKTATQLSMQINQGGNFPSLALWHVFRSLFKGVIGLAYPIEFIPAAFRHTFNDDRVPLASESSLRLPKLTAWGNRQTIVHFDLDLTNILIGDYDTDEHNLLPIAKIADLGLALPIDGYTWRSSSLLWACRKCGKRTIYTPEQFTEEWDHIKDNPCESGAKVAGNYNWWTNLYQLGIIMYNLITLREYEAGPVPALAELRYPDGSVKEVWGYGMDLLVCPYSNIDFDLVNVVAACLCHDPADRPDMHDLERLIDSKVEAQPMDGPGADLVRQWSMQHFQGAPPPSYKKMPTGRERIFREHTPVLDDSSPGEDPAGLLPAALTDVQKARLDEFRRNNGLPPMDYNQPIVQGIPDSVAAGQQPGSRVGRGQPGGAWAAGPPGRQPGGQAGRGQQPRAQAGRGRGGPAQAPAGRGRGGQTQAPAGRGRGGQGPRPAGRGRGRGGQHQAPAGRGGRGGGQQPRNQGGRGRGRGRGRGGGGQQRGGFQQAGRGGRQGG
ncbi:kinase-like domain-containing protein [Sordaria brevicollis]|uniref:non-specific serine/threonine protein kinase n=1 Tax=Sordaria brevicollis TaxID=83679 RepID=A0AAE0U2N2_SORBR|nr:kinase-like domain-containing protein [Sordaria brevicollis]